MRVDYSNALSVGKDFLLFSRITAKRLFFCGVAVLDALSLCVLKIRGFFVILKKGSVTFLMRRKYNFVTDRVVYFSFGCAAFFLTIGLPVSNSVLVRDDMKAKLEAEEFLLSVEEGVLVQNNISVTVANYSAVRPAIVEYIVQPGDTLFEIGRRFNVTVESLGYINNLANRDYLSPGTKLKIPPVSGVIHLVKAGDSISSVAQRWNVSAQAIVDANWLDEPYLLAVGQELVVPGAEVPAPVVLAAQQPAGPNTGLQLAPVDLAAGGGLGFPSGGVITQYFSWRHPAVDFAERCGSPVVAAADGEIYFADWWAGGGGYSVMINHGNGYVTKYAHLSGFAVRGGFVSKGQVIGYMGATGRAYGCHVHFVVEFNGRAVNPLSL